MKFTITVLLLTFTQIKGQTEQSACGIVGPNLIPLMTNANHTHRRWPWHSAIYHRYSEADPIYQCGGTVISPNEILTAAHCVSKNGVRMESKHILVSLGRLFLNATESRGAQSYEVDRVNIHPNYNDYNLDNDIAIIRLSAEVQFNTYVHPICLWKSGKTDLSEIVGKFGTVIGWGKTETGQTSNVLRQASLPVVSWPTCLESNRAFAGSVLTERNFCAGIRNGTSVCSGDSGGSMTFEENGIYFIRGIVSSTPVEMNHNIQELVCNSMEYAVFTDVAHYLQWIRDTATIVECEGIVRCEWSVANKTCSVNINVEDSAKKCKIVFDEYSNTAVTSLKINGESDTIPDIADAIAKFSYLDSLTIDRNKLKIVERDRLTAFGEIQELDLSFNEIIQLDADTFDDLKNLEVLKVSSNRLKDVHVDLFKELRNLETLWIGFNKIGTLPAAIFQNNKRIKDIGLSGNRLKVLPINLFKDLRNLEYLALNQNQIEILPPDLFRSNDNLRYVFLAFNKLAKIESNFYNMPKITQDFDSIYNKIINNDNEQNLSLYMSMVSITLQGNVCIDENFNITTNRESSLFLERIQINCSD